VGPPSRHARHTSATSRVLSFSGAMALASCSHSPRLARAIGTRCFIAAWGAMRPCWTSPCTSDGSSWTSASRRETQLGLRSNRSASSSWPKPWLSDSADSSHPCSRADSGAELRMDRASTSASASLRSHCVAWTRSWPRRRRARTRLWPSMTTYLPASCAATTTIGTCWPLSAIDPRSLRSRSGRRTRRLSYRRSSW